MSQNFKPIVIDENTGEVLPHLKPTQKYHAPTIPAAYKRGKQGQQLLTLMDAFLNPSKYNIIIYLGENKFGLKYCIIGSKLLFIDSLEFRDQVTHMAITHLGFVEFSNTALNHLIQVLRTNEAIWVKDQPAVNTPSIRVVNQGYPNIFYAYLLGNFISLVNPNHYQQICYQGVINPKQAEWPSRNYPWKMFTPETLAEMTSSPENHVPNFDALLVQIQIPLNLKLICMSLLIHHLIADQHILMEISSEVDAHSECIFKYFKALIDPVIDYAKPLPKKAEDIKRYALEEHLLSFDNPSDKKLSQEQQETILGLLKGSATIDALPKSKYPSKCQLNRPILLRAPDSIVNLPALRERMISIQFPRTTDFNLSYIDTTLIENARLELIRLSQLVCYVNYPQFHVDQMPFSVELKEFRSLKGIIHIGCELSRIFTGTTDRFVEEFREWAIGDLFVQLDNNDGAYLVYLWAKDHTSSEAKQPLKDWLNELNFYAKAEGINIDKISPRKLGADLKQAKSLLEKLGIHCISHGNSKRLSLWQIKVDKEIGVNNSIIVKPRFG